MGPFDTRLLTALPEARPAVTALTAVGVANGVAAIAQAFAVSAVVVAVVRSNPVTTPVAWLVGILAVRALIAAVGELVSSAAGTRVATSLRRAVVADWLTRPADDRPRPARAQTLAAQGAAAVEPYVARYLPTLVTACVLPPLVLLAVTLVDPLSAVICLVTLPLLPVFAALIGHATADASAKRWASMTSLAGHYLDTVRGLPTLVAYGRAERQSAQLREVSEGHRNATMATLRIAFMSSAALELLATIATAIVAVSVGIRLTWGTMELGPAIVAIMLAPEAYWPIRRVGQEFHNAADGAEAARELLDELDKDTARPAPVAGSRPALDRVTYRYPDADTDVVRDRDLVIGPGITVLVGPSGVGKTTTLELLAGLRRPTSGSAVPVDMHVVTQRPFLPAGTLRDALLLGTDAADPADGTRTTTDTDLMAALDTVGLRPMVDALPQGLDTPTGDDGFGFSAGQRARLAIARALLTDADVIGLDEPTGHLDPESAAVARAAIRSLAESRPVVVVTHRPEVQRLADTLVELR